MNIYLPLAILLTLICFGFRFNEKNSKRALWITMMIACAVLAVRYGFGPDYVNYWDIYSGIRGSNVEGYTGTGSSTESAFLYVLSAFPSYTSFIVTFTLLLFMANTLYIHKYVNPRYYWLAILFMFIEPTFLLLELVAMRSAIGAILFIIALFFLLKGKRLIYIALIILASLIHTSCIVLVLLVFLNTSKKSILFNNLLPFVCLALAVLTILLGQNFSVEGLVDYAVDTIEELNRYEGYQDSIGGVVQSLNSFLFKIMSFVILLYLTNAGKKEMAPDYVIIYKIAVFTAMIQIIFGQSLIGDRYLMILNIVYISAIARSILTKQIIDYKIVLSIIAIIAVYMLYSKMGRDYNVSYLVYHTVFSAPYIP